MNIFHVFVAALLGLPVLEIFLLVQAGGAIGIVPTALLVIATGLWGAWLFRIQGMSTWARLQSALARGELPTMELVEGPLLLVGGALLVTPGFVTDLLGLACLLPQTRRPLAAYLLQTGWLKAAIHGRMGADASRTIDGEFRREGE